MINGKFYDVLKTISLVVLPVLGTLYFTLAQIWGLPAVEEVLGTIAAVDAAIGVFLRQASTKYLKNEVGEGILHVEKTDDGKGMRLELDETPEELAAKTEVRFRVKRSEQEPDGGFKY